MPPLTPSPEAERAQLLAELRRLGARRSAARPRHRAPTAAPHRGGGLVRALPSSDRRPPRVRGDRGQGRRPARGADRRARDSARARDRPARARGRASRGQPCLAPGTWPISPAAASTTPRIGDFLAAVSNKYAGVFFAGPGRGADGEHAGPLGGGPGGLSGRRPRARSRRAAASPRSRRSCAARDAHGIAGAEVRTRGRVPHDPGASLPREGAPDRRTRRGAAPPRRDGRTPPHAARRAGRGHRRRPRGRAPALAHRRRRRDDRHRGRGSARRDRLRRRARALLVPRGRGVWRLLPPHRATGAGCCAGIERSDSVVLDPHKGLFLPYGSGIVVCRDAAPLAAAHEYSGAYMQDAVRDPTEGLPPTSRPSCRSTSAGCACGCRSSCSAPRPFRAALEEKLLLARYFHEEVRALGFEMGPPPDLSIVTYRWAPPGRRARADQPNQPADRGRRPARRPDLPLLDHARWPVHPSDGRAGIPNPPAERSTWRSACCASRPPRSEAGVVTASRPRLIGLPYDASSSFLQGPAEAPPLIRAALHSPASNAWAHGLREVLGRRRPDRRRRSDPAAARPMRGRSIEAGVAEVIADGLAADRARRRPLRDLSRRSARSRESTGRSPSCTSTRTPICTTCSRATATRTPARSRGSWRKDWRHGWCRWGSAP